MSDYLDKGFFVSPAEYKYRYEHISRYLPKLRCSNNFGSSLLDELKTDDHLFDKLLSNRPLHFQEKMD